MLSVPMPEESLPLSGSQPGRGHQEWEKHEPGQSLNFCCAAMLGCVCVYTQCLWGTRSPDHTRPPCATLPRHGGGHGTLSLLPIRFKS